jgi:serine/threonine-protein kinase
MREMLAALTTLRQRSDSGILYLAPPPPEKPTRRIDRPPPPKASRTRPILVIVALLALASAAAWWWTSRRETQVRNPAISSSRSPNALNNQAILDMVENKVPESAIIAQIRSSPTDFDLSTSEIIRLTKAGASEIVLRQMRNPTAEPAPPPAPPTHTVEIAGGIPFEIELSEDVLPDSLPGQTLHFAAVADVTVGGTVVISKGAPVTGVVMSSAHKRFLVHSARPTFRLLEATAVNGSKIKVRSSEGRLGEQRKDKSLDPIAGPKPQNGTVSAGSRFYAYFDGDQTLTLPDSRVSTR